MRRRYQTSQSSKLHRFNGFERCLREQTGGSYHPIEIVLGSSAINTSFDLVPQSLHLYPCPAPTDFIILPHTLHFGFATLILNDERETTCSFSILRVLGSSLSSPKTFTRSPGLRARMTLRKPLEGSYAAHSSFSPASIVRITWPPATVTGMEA